MQTTARRLLLAGFLLLPASNTPAATIHVPSDQPSVAAALQASEPNDTIVLAPGVYTETNLTLTAGVTLRGSGDTPAETVIDAAGQGRILMAEDLPDSVIVQNLTLRNAAAVGKNNHEKSGGAVFFSKVEARVENCVFENNSADTHGGAIRIALCWPLIRNCTFRDNEGVNGGGGAIEASFGASPVVAGCLFENNSARWGGAISVRMGGSVSVLASRLVGNVAAGDLGYGGAVFADNGSVVGLVNVILSGNRARFGGGVACFASSQVNLDNVTVTDNAATVLGGGMIMIDASPHITNTIFAFNQGAAIGLAGASDPDISCTNLFGNTGGDWSSAVIATSNMLTNYAYDPLFCSRDPLVEGGLHLQHGSYLLDPPNGCATMGAESKPCGATSTGQVPSATGIGSVAASPNPFNPQTDLRFALNQEQQVQVAVYGVRGELVRELAAGRLAAGEHEVTWRGKDQSGRVVGSGVYFLVVRGETETKTLKVTMLK